MADSSNNGKRKNDVTDTLDSICERGKSKFTNPIEVRYHFPEDDVVGDFPYFLIAEAITKPRLIFFKRIEYRPLFAIDPAFRGQGSGLKQVVCSIYEPALLEIANEEMQNYVKKVGATVVYLKKEVPQ